MTAAGMEVPITGGDRIQWVEIAVPSSSSSSPPSAVPMDCRNVASCHVIPGDPPAYIIWRIHKNLPNVLEVVELFPGKEFPEVGLHLVFKDALYPYAFLCKNESAAGNAYLLYVLTVSGVGYLFRLKSPSAYISGSSFPLDDLLELDIQAHTQVKVTAVAAISGCIIIGLQDGSIACYRLGVVDPRSPDFVTELRDDTGIGRLWNIMSRAKVVGAVQDMLISQLCERKLIFVLHLDGCLRIWDLSNQNRILHHNFSSHEFAGSAPCRIWVSDANYSTNLIFLAVLHSGPLVPDIIALYNFSFIAGDKISLSSEPLKIIRLEEERLIDLKMHSSKLWILKEDGSILYDLSQSDFKVEHSFSYDLQEDFIADQLFQRCEHTLDDLVWNNNSIFSMMKDQISYFISSIFLRRLLQPGVYQSAALRAVIADHKKYLSDYEFQSLTIPGLKKEILAIIEDEGIAMNPSTMVYYWKRFCAIYFRYWCQNNMPYGLFIDSSNGVIGLIRKNSVSVFRTLKGVELLIYGSSEFRDLKSSELILLDSDIDCGLLIEVLRCINDMSHQLGRAATAIFYESLVCQVISSDDILLHLLKVLETGQSPSWATSLIPQVGIDSTWDKKQAAHKSQRKFSVYMLLSLHALRIRAASWTKVLDVVEKFLKYLKPQKNSNKFDLKGICNINSSFLVEATLQVARVMFESAFDVLLFLGYLVNIGGQVDMVQSDLTLIKNKLIPMLQEILAQWLIIHFLGSTPTTPQTMDDFNTRLSSLNIGNKADKRSMDGKLGSSDFTLACLLDFPISYHSHDFLCSTSLPNSNELSHSVQKLSSLIVWGRTGQESSFPSNPTLELISILLCHGQYEAAEVLSLMVDAYANKIKANLSIWSTDGELFARFHLLGFCHLLRAQNGLHGFLKEQKINDAIRCFFRAASGNGVSPSLLYLYSQTGFSYSGESGSVAQWKFNYYQWAMQIFEQYGFYNGACQFALASLVEVDETIGLIDGDNDNKLLESSITIRGRVWANIFKFTLDLKHYRDAYCAIVSNPDEDSKFICLRRFIIVLCELGATKVLCDGKLPFVGLVEKVEQELVWKAERSDVSSRLNLYKLLYAFEAYRNNWRKAASYMYQYCLRLRKEAITEENRRLSSALQEIVAGLSTVINALQLVDDPYAWIEIQHDNSSVNDQGSPNKRARNVLEKVRECQLLAVFSMAPQTWRVHGFVDVEMLEKEYVLFSAQYLLTLTNDKFKLSEKQPLANLVDVLIQENLYDMAFTVVIKFWKGSGLERELEQAFIAISQKCCLDRLHHTFIGSDIRTNILLLPSSEDEANSDGKINVSSGVHHFNGNSQWETLELYLGKYMVLHPRLPVTVAKTLLQTDPQMELPLWLVRMFKGGKRGTSWGMTEKEPDPATLFRLYVDCGRHAEATYLLLEYLESFVALKPVDAINRKRMSAVWFPHTAIERLWCQLEELRRTGNMVDQCDKLKRLLHGALLNHLRQVKVDSEDAESCGFEHSQGEHTAAPMPAV